MKMIGISVYTGMDYSLEDNLKYIEMANSYGIKTIFTSFHIPEASPKGYVEVKEILKRAKELDIKVIADISKGFMDRIDVTEHNIYALRLDFGFSIEEIAALTKNLPFKIQINGSTISKDYLEQLVDAGALLENIEVGHNYYPRRDTGISYDLLVARNKIFKEYGLKIMAFVASRSGKRGPIHEGLPTLEDHRDLNPIVAAQHLLHSHVNLVVVGDAFATEEEIKGLSSISKDVYTIPYKSLDLSEGERQVICGIHTNRMDPGKSVIRSSQARERRIIPIKANNTIERKKYSITIDNEGYLRYEGELQISKEDLKADNRVNVVGDASESALLIQMIKPGDSFLLLPEP